MEDLKKDFQWYLDNQEELVKLYNGKVLIIVKGSVVGSFDTEREAYLYAKDKYGLGNFIMQKCSTGDKDYTAIYHSRVRINYANATI